MANQPTQAGPAQPAPPQIVPIPANQRTPMNNEEDARYLLEFHRIYEQKLSKILLQAGKDLERLVTKATDDIDRLAFVIHESTVSRQPPLWDLLSNGDDDEDESNGRPTCASVATPNMQPPTSSIRDQTAPKNPMTGDEELQIALAMINKLNGTTHTQAEVEASRIFLEHATSLCTNAGSSTRPSSEVSNTPSTSHSTTNTDVGQSITLHPADVEAANVLLDLYTAPANTTIVDTLAAAPGVQKKDNLPAASKGKHKAKTNKRKAAVEKEYSDSDYPHHRHIGPEGGDPLGISDPSKGPAQVMEEMAPPTKRTRTRRWIIGRF